jgi:hypothetical protein
VSRPIVAVASTIDHCILHTRLGRFLKKMDGRLMVQSCSWHHRAQETFHPTIQAFMFPLARDLMISCIATFSKGICNERAKAAEMPTLPMGIENGRIDS